MSTKQGNINSNKKKSEQLCMPHGTACGRLKKSMMFQLAKELGKDVCFQCNKKIIDVKQFSIDHKIPWLDSDNPPELFFDLENIAFSHLSCNSGACRSTRVVGHPSLTAYRNGCRCKECSQLNTEKCKDYRERKKLK